MGVATAEFLLALWYALLDDNNRQVDNNRNWKDQRRDIPLSYDMIRLFKVLDNIYNGE